MCIMKTQFHLKDTDNIDYETMFVWKSLSYVLVIDSSKYILQIQRLQIIHQRIRGMQIIIQ